MAEDKKKLFDGLPPSSVQITQRRIPLIKVRLLDNPKCTLMIARDKFDRDVHELVQEKKPAAAPDRVKLAPEPDELEVSTHTAEEMATFSMKALRALPEYVHINGPSKSKDELILQILKVREDAAA